MSYDLCIKDLGFLIVSIILIGVLDARSNLKPLNLYPKMDQQSRTNLGFRSKIFAFISMGFFGMK
jgi:hypothetical protein